MSGIIRKLPATLAANPEGAKSEYSPMEITKTLCNYIYLPWGDSKKEAEALGLVYKIYTKPEGTEKEKVAVESFLGNILVKGLERKGAEAAAVRRANLLKMAAYVCTAMGSGGRAEPFEGDLAQLKKAAEILAEKQWRTPGEVLKGVKPQD